MKKVVKTKKKLRLTRPGTRLKFNVIATDTTQKICCIKLKILEAFTLVKSSSDLSQGAA